MTPPVHALLRVERVPDATKVQGVPTALNRTPWETWEGYSFRCNLEIFPNPDVLSC